MWIYLSYSGMLSCVTKEEFVDFTIQIIEKSMGWYIQFWETKKQTNATNSMQLNITPATSITYLMGKYKSHSHPAFMRKKTKELKTPVKIHLSCHQSWSNWCMLTWSNFMFDLFIKMIEWPSLNRHNTYMLTWLNFHLKFKLSFDTTHLHKWQIHESPQFIRWLDLTSLSSFILTGDAAHLHIWPRRVQP